MNLMLRNSTMSATASCNRFEAKSHMKTRLLFAFFLIALSTHAQLLTLPVGGVDPAVVLKGNGEITLREPDGPRGQYKHGFRVLNDSAAEWQKYYGVAFEVKLL